MNNIRERQTLEHQGGYAVAKKIYKRKKGEWVMTNDIPSICPNCGANWIDDYVDSRELYFTGKIPNYCPNCGAGMAGEQDE